MTNAERILSMTNKELHEFLSMWKDGDMTNQEAKEVEKLKHAISSIKANMSYSNGRLCSAGEIAIEALEKQIPKKPICIEDKMWVCPVCDNNLLHKWAEYPTKLMPASVGLPYCLSCGQAIDWSEED